MAVELEGVDLVEDPASADVILLGGPDEGWTYPRLNAVFRRLVEGVPLVAMQRNRWWPTVDGPSLDAGAFVAGLEYATGAEATVVGKPAAGIFEVACELAGAPPSEAAMIGDDLESDLRPARALGMCAVLVRTGKGSTFSPRAGRCRRRRARPGRGGRASPGLAEILVGRRPVVRRPDRVRPDPASVRRAGGREPVLAGCNRRAVHDDVGELTLAPCAWDMPSRSGRGRAG